jgi:isopenicillin-N epimerase
MERRNFLIRTGLTLGASVLTAHRYTEADEFRVNGRPQAGSPDWKWVRDQFAFTRDRINMACMLIASHPREVREAVDRHCRGFDEDPITYLMTHYQSGEAGVLNAAAEYMGVEATDIAITTSTTMGLGLLYGGLAIRSDQEILTTYHDHVATDSALHFKAKASGASFRRVRLYQESDRASQGEIIDEIQKAIRPNTRIIALTYVHSTSGVKLPLKQIAEVVSRANAGRDEADRALLCVDGVHGFGIENVKMSDLGCDFFASGTHKWIFGPNGTGLLWGRPEVWKFTNPMMDSVALRDAWMKDDNFASIRKGPILSPGGLSAFEHRWAVAEAIRFHLSIGKPAIERRIHGLAAQLKEGLKVMSHVKLRTPIGEDLSSGIVCLDVDGMSAESVVAALAERRILATLSATRIEDQRPYHVHHVRLTPGVLNDEHEVDETLRAIRELPRSTA